jgi:hypothetical protein
MNKNDLKAISKLYVEQNELQFKGEDSVVPDYRKGDIVRLENDFPEEGIDGSVVKILVSSKMKHIIP